MHITAKILKWSSLIALAVNLKLKSNGILLAALASALVGVFLESISNALDEIMKEESAEQAKNQEENK